MDDGSYIYSCHSSYVQVFRHSCCCQGNVEKEVSLARLNSGSKDCVPVSLTFLSYAADLFQL